MEKQSEIDSPVKDILMLYIVCGLPGTGKTTVAHEIARITGSVILRTDEVRKDIFPEPRYTTDEKKAVYAEMLRQAASALRSGKSVVLDATFSGSAQRELAVKTAKESGSGYMILEVVCNEEAVRKRIGKRKGGLSDADFSVFEKIKREWEPIDVAHRVIDNSNRKWRKDLKKMLGGK